jgi:hypothetical protein
VKALTSSAKICQDLPVVSQDFHPFSDFTGKQQGFHGYIWGYNMIHDIIWDKVINHDHRHHLGLSKNIQTLGMRCMHQHIAVQMAKRESFGLGFQWRHLKLRPENCRGQSCKYPEALALAVEGWIHRFITDSKVENSLFYPW